jgi:hypothetical protein
MEFEYIKNQYKVPAEINREVIISGRKGIIQKDMGNYIGVTFYDDKNKNIVPAHPTWEVEYLETFGKPIKMSKSKERYSHYLSLDCEMSFFEYLKSSYCL